MSNRTGRSSRNSRRSSRPSRRPLGPWDRTPAGIRAALISTPILLILFLINSVGITLFSATEIWGLLIFYPVQVFGYLLNGVIAGIQARSSHLKSTRRVGHRHEVVQKTHPNYMAQGTLAGVVLAVIALLIYVVANSTAGMLIPYLDIVLTIIEWVVGGPAPVALLLIADVIICIGAGTVGGLIYDRVFS